MTSVASNWHTRAPAVYLDQWVWIRFARVVRGNPQEPSDVAVLEAVVAAAERGVTFPLSATHYEETLRISDPRQRRDLAGVMAPISKIYTLRNHSDLVRHQLLVAMHETVGRPTFLPARPQVLGLGVHWALLGVEGQMRVLNSGGTVQDADPAWLRQATQYYEAQALAGPGDEDIPLLRTQGYLDVRELETRPGNRLAWEQLFADRLVKHSPPPSRSELRVWLLARELVHEYVDVLTRLLGEYRLTFESIAGRAEGKHARRRAVEFAERVPTLRIAAEMKLEMFRNPSRRWSQNMVRDIDAISLALPYCRVVVADRDAVNLLSRSGAPERHGSRVVHQLLQLPDVLDEIATDDPSAAGAGSTGWDTIGPGEGFQPDMPAPLNPADLPPGCVVRLCGPDGPLTERRRAE